MSEPQEHAVTAQASDPVLEHEAMVVLSELEQLATRLEEKLVQASPGLVLEYLTNITNRVVRFVAALPTTTLRQFSLETLMAQDPHGFVALRPHHIHRNQVTRETVVDLETPLARQVDPQLFQHLCQDLLHITRIYLLLSVRAFASASMANEWRQIYGSFFHGLSRTIETMHSRRQGRT
jgi:hypothetical protein